MKIEWETHVPFALELPFSQLADSCLSIEGVAVPAMVHVLLTDDFEIQEINREQRGVDAATDVLSFPTVAYPQAGKAGSCERLLRRETDPEEGCCFLGDIVISVEHATAQAAEYGHSLLRELCYLFVHAVFHLLGYDHMEEEERREMRAMEEKALNRSGIARSEEVLVSDEELLEMAREACKYSYSPYSHYPVGAALLCENGRVYQGCNIENGSFGLTNCAERTAVFKAVSEGITRFLTIAIAADRTAPYPCGACRQVLSEFAPNIRVLVTWGENHVEETTLSQLLPHQFDSAEMAKE